MIITALFCLFVALAFSIPGWAFVVGALCALMGPFVALFGLFLCIAVDAAWWVWVIGLLCMMADVGASSK